MSKKVEMKSSQPPSAAFVARKEMIAKFDNMMKEMPLPTIKSPVEAHFEKDGSKMVLNVTLPNTSFNDHAVLIRPNGPQLNYINLKYWYPLHEIVVSGDKLDDGELKQCENNNPIYISLQYPLMINGSAGFAPVLFKYDPITRESFLLSEDERKVIVDITFRTFDAYNKCCEIRDTNDRTSMWKSCITQINRSALRIGFVKDMISTTTPFSRFRIDIESQPDYMIYLSDEEVGMNNPNLFHPDYLRSMSMKQVIKPIFDTASFIESNSSILTESLAEVEKSTLEAEQANALLLKVSVLHATIYNKVKEERMNVASSYDSKIASIDDKMKQLSANNPDFNRVSFMAKELAKDKIDIKTKNNVIVKLDSKAVKDAMEIIMSKQGEDRLEYLLLIVCETPSNVDGCIKYDIESTYDVLRSMQNSFSIKATTALIHKELIREFTNVVCTFMDSCATIRNLGITGPVTFNEIYSVLQSSPLFQAYVPPTDKEIEAKLKLPYPAMDVKVSDKAKDGIRNTMARIKGNNSINVNHAMKKGALSTSYKSMGSTKTPVSGKGSSVISRDSGAHFLSTDSSSSFGDHTIVGQNTVRYIPTIPEPQVAQNIITQSIPLVTTNLEHVYWGDSGYTISTYLHNPNNVPSQSFGTRRNHTFRRFYDSNLNIQTTNIVWGPPIQIDEMDVSQLDNIGGADPPDARRFISQVQGNIVTCRRFGELTAHLMPLYTNRYDMTAIYTIGYIIMLMLEDFESTNTPYIIGPAVADAISAINFDVNDQAASAAISDNIATMLASARITLSARDYTNVHYCVMRMISTGPTIIQTAAGSNYQHIGSTIRLNGNSIRWGLWDDQPINLVNVYTSVTSYHVGTFLSTLAAHNNDIDAMVAGFVQASTILNGRVHEVRIRDAAGNRFFTSTLEVGRIRLARPVGFNFLWNVIRLQTRRTNTDLFNTEFETIRGNTPSTLNQVSCVLATAISIGTSAALHSFNITGVDINESLAVIPGPSTLNEFMRSVSHLRDGNTAVLLLMACGFISQFSDMTINPLVFQNRAWNDSMAFMASQGDITNDFYDGAFGHVVPYDVDPMAAAFLLDAWPDLFGVMAPNVTFNVTEEITLLGPTNMRRWSAVNGSHEYEQIATSIEPYVWSPYGAMIINHIRQHWNVTDEWPIIYEVYEVAGNRFRYMGDTEGEEHQPVWDEEFRMMRPGTSLTWNWRLHRSIAPALDERIGQNIFYPLLSAGFNALTNSGLYLNRTPRGMPLNVGIMGSSVVRGLNNIMRAGIGRNNQPALSEN